MSITKTTCQNFRADFAKAMKALEEKYQLEINLGNITFNADEIRSKVTASRKTQGGVDAAANTRLVRNSSGRVSYGDIVTIYGEKYRMLDYNGRARNYPFIGEKLSNGSKYKLPMDAVMEAVV